MVVQNKKNIPELRFEEFKGGWVCQTIQSLIDNGTIIGHLDGNHGELYPRSEEFSSKGIPYVTASDLDGNTVNLRNSKRLPVPRAKQFKKGIAMNDDVIFAHNATVGPVGILVTNLDYVIFSTTVTYYRCNLNKIDNYFLLSSLSTIYFIRQYSRVMSQSTRNQVPITMQRRFFLQLPKLAEQQKIATFLGSVDTKLNKLRLKRELLETWKRGLMQKIFSQQLRFTQDDDTAFFDWEEKKVSDVYRWVKTNSLSRVKLTYQKGDIQNIHYGDIHTKYFVQFDQDVADAPFIKDRKASKNITETEFCKNGDIVIADASEDLDDIGKSIEIINVKSNSLVAGLHTYIARPKDSFRSGFSGYLFQSNDFRKQVKRIAQGVSVLGI